jgi:hypothetical protein
LAGSYTPTNTAEALYKIVDLVRKLTKERYLLQNNDNHDIIRVPEKYFCSKT